MKVACNPSMQIKKIRQAGAYHHLLKQCIGVGRFRILGGGGARSKILGGQGGPNSQQAHDVEMTFLINPCQIIAFLILKASTKFRIERNSFASTFKSN